MLPQTEALLLEDVLLDARDGLVRCKQQLWYHFQRFPWNLENPEENPKFGEHSRQVRSRISQGLPQDHGSNFLPGSYHLGISPHIDSYYHLITDLLPHLILGQPKPVLIPKWIPEAFKVFLQGCGFETKELGEEIFRVERLELPMMPVPDWNPVKFRLVQNFIHKLLEERRNRFSPPDSLEKVFLSRRYARRRHLVNEDELLPILKQHGFKVLIAEEHDVVEQIEIFSQLTHLIAPHGAGLVNGMFAKPGARILEIRPVISSGDYCFDDLFQCGEFQHEVLVPKKRGRFLLDPELLDDTLRRWEQTETSLRRFACV